MEQSIQNKPVTTEEGKPRDLPGALSLRSVSISIIASWGSYSATWNSFVFRELIDLGS
jgi:hypothetical protein